MDVFFIEDDKLFHNIMVFRINSAIALTKNFTLNLSTIKKN